MLLDEHRLGILIETLVRAKEIGFSCSSSPVLPLLEVMIDLALKLKEQLQQGSTFWSERFNPGLKFLETHQDALGNPKSIKLEFRRFVACDPQLANYFSQLAQDLIQVKRLQRLPEHLYCTAKQEAAPQKIKPSCYHFFRRTQKRRQKQKAH